MVQCIPFQIFVIYTDSARPWGRKNQFWVTQFHLFVPTIRKKARDVID